MVLDQENESEESCQHESDSSSLLSMPPQNMIFPINKPEKREKREIFYKKILPTNPFISNT